MYTTPWPAAEHPAAEPTALRLLVETRPGYAEAKQDVLATVQRTLGNRWRVAPLFPYAGDDPECQGLARFFTVTANVSIGELHAADQNPWDLAYGVRDAGDFVSVVPDLPHSSYGQESSYGISGATREPLPGSEPRDWALNNIRCPQAWEVPTPPGGADRGRGIVIGHPDTGYTDHPELERAALDLSDDIDIVDGDFDAHDPLTKRWPLDSPGHGTLTGSVIASRAPGEMVGAAPLATVVPIRTIRSVVNVFDGNVAQAVDYARRIGCHVVSMSLGGGFFSGLEEAINCAVRKGLIVMAAAGNYSPFVVWPALYPNCIAVAASNAEDAPWAYSSHGGKVAISAPGESVWAASFDLAKRPPAPGVGRHSGTSFAVAHLAGVAALWLAHYGRDALIDRFGRPRLQAAFLQVLRSAGYRRPARWETGEYGVGIVDAEALLKAPLPDPDSLPPTESLRVSGQAAPRPELAQLIAAVCPELSTAQVNARLSKLFAARGARLEDKLLRYGGELLYVLGEKREVREAFVRGDLSRPASARAPARPSLRTALSSAVSEALLSEISRA